jgi:hypothetical protein
MLIPASIISHGGRARLLQHTHPLVDADGLFGNNAMGEKFRFTDVHVKIKEEEEK